MDLAAIIFTPLLQNFPITFNLVQGFILCLAGDTYFQVRFFFFLGRHMVVVWGVSCHDDVSSNPLSMTKHRPTQARTD